MIRIQIRFRIIGERQRERRLIESDGLFVDEAELSEIVFHRGNMVMMPGIANETALPLPRPPDLRMRAIMEGATHAGKIVVEIR
jgi:hypothetical protein